MLEDALSVTREIFEEMVKGLNPYYAGRCSFRQGNYDRRKQPPSLNPYYAGRCSFRPMAHGVSTTLSGLNPYYAGRCSFSSSIEGHPTSRNEEVLILIMLEDALSVKIRDNYGNKEHDVLILIMLEDALSVHTFINLCKLNNQS